MIEINTRQLHDIVSRFEGKKILVLGDLMMDRYIWGQVGRISPEAPVPVVEVKKDSFCLGGAGNVIRNMETLGACPLAVGIVGDDPEGSWIKSQMRDPRGVFVVSGRPTTVKTRILAHHQQVVRVDLERRGPLPRPVEEKMMKLIRENDIEGICLSDYSKGVLTRSLISELLPYAAEKEIPVFVDPKVDNFPLYSPVTLITPNHVEAERIVHRKCDTDEQVERAGKKILEKISSRFLFIKRGEKGLTVFEKDRPPFHIPAIAKEVFDVTGAGDTVISVASLAILSGASIDAAAVLANAAAGIVVGKIGTASLTRTELLEGLRMFRD